MSALIRNMVKTIWNEHSVVFFRELPSGHEPGREQGGLSRSLIGLEVSLSDTRCRYA
jgi:hypothetical protein